MEEDDLWLSEDEDGSDHELELSTDPARFNMSLTPQEGQSGGKASVGGEEVPCSDELES